MNVLSAPSDVQDELLWDAREAMLGYPALEIDVEDLLSGEYLFRHYCPGLVHGSWWCQYYWPSERHQDEQWYLQRDQEERMSPLGLAYESWKRQTEREDIMQRMWACRSVLLSPAGQVSI